MHYCAYAYVARRASKKQCLLAVWYVSKMSSNLQFWDLFINNVIIDEILVFLRDLNLKRCVVLNLASASCAMHI